MNHCKIQLWYNKQRVKKSGDATLYLRLSVGSEMDDVKLPISWPVKYFDWKKRLLKPRYENDADYNTYIGYIERIRNNYWEIIRRFINNNQRFTLSDIFKASNYFLSGNTLCEFMAQHIKIRQKTTKLKDKIKPSTARVHASSLERVREYLGNTDIPLTEVDDTWLEDFADHLKASMQESSAWVKIQNVKSYLSYAERNKIQVNKNYKLFTMSFEDEEAEFLEDFEMEKFLELYEKAELPADLMQVLRSFLFACVTGMRVSDLMRWRKDWIKDNNIVFIPTKIRISVTSPKPVEIPIMPMAQNFINQLKGETLEIASDVVYNRQLKIIAVKAGVNKVITSHVARHTFGTWMLMAGVPELILSKIMGHKNVETTRKYTHIAQRVKARAIMMGQTQFEKFMPKPKPPEKLTDN